MSFLKDVITNLQKYKGLNWLFKIAGALLEKLKNTDPLSSYESNYKSVLRIKSENQILSVITRYY